MIRIQASLHYLVGNGGSTFFRNVGILSQHYKASTQKTSNVHHLGNLKSRIINGWIIKYDSYRVSYSVC